MHEKSKTVLIVEDDRQTAEFERQALLGAGISVKTVSYSEDAIRVLQTEPIALVLLDYQLPRGDSWLVLEAAKGAIPSVPVVLVTAMGDERVAEEAIQRGVYDYVRKAENFWEHLPSIIERVCKLRDAEHELSVLAAIVESSEDAIISFQLDGIIRTWNPGAAKIYGYSRSEIVGKNISLLSPSDRADESLQILDKIRRGDCLQHFETIRLRKNGTSFPVSLTISPMRDASERVVGATDIDRDITKGREVEMALKSVNESLSMKIKELEKLNEIMMGREERILELKEKLEKLGAK